MKPEKIIDKIKLSTICDALGWQGGTRWQALEELKAIMQFQPDKESKHYKIYTLPAGFLHIAKTEARRSFLEHSDNVLNALNFNATTLID